MREDYTTKSRVEDDLTLVADDTRTAQRIDAAMNASHAFVDDHCGRRFDRSASEAREFVAYYAADWLHVGDMAIVPTQVRIKRTRSGAWTVLDPASEWAVRPPEHGRPWRVLLRPDGLCWPQDVFPRVEVTTEWGWAAVPAFIEEATRLIAVRYVARPKWSVMQFSSDGSSLLRVDPDVELILSQVRLER